MHQILYRSGLLRAENVVTPAMVCIGEGCGLPLVLFLCSGRPS